MTTSRFGWEPGDIIVDAVREEEERKERALGRLAARLRTWDEGNHMTDAVNGEGGDTRARASEPAPEVVRAPTLAVEIAKLTLARGDILVVKVDEHLSKETVTQIKNNLHRIVGGEVRILLLSKGFSLGVLTKGEIEAMADADT